MFRVGLNGGIASGKTAVANLFATHDVPVIDTDVIAREVVEPGQPALAAVVDAFGPQVLAEDGRLDRPRLREQIRRCRRGGA
jgi:dephospho-CoA kinase